MSYEMLAYNPAINSKSTGTEAENATHRIVLYPPAFEKVWPTKFFIQLGCRDDGESTISKVYFGLSAANTGGNEYDFADPGTITEVTFGGTSGVVLSGGDALSDTIEFELAPTQTHVLSIHTTSASGNETQWLTSTTVIGKFQSYTREGGDYAADVALGTPTTTHTNTKVYFIQELHENDDWPGVDATLPLVTKEIPAYVEGACTSTLPGLLLSMAMNTQVWTEVPLDMPCLSLVASIGDRLGLEEKLCELHCEASAAPRGNEDARLSELNCSATMLRGATASLSKTLGFPTLSILSGTGVSSKFPVLSLDIEITEERTGALDRDIPFLSISAEGGREGVGSVDAILFVPELVASSGATQARLSVDFCSLQISATGGLESSLDAHLSLMTVSATGHGADSGLELPLFVLDVLATGHGMDKGLELPLFMLDILATGHGMDVGLDLPLFMLDISATGTNRQTTLDKDCFSLELVAAASGMQSALAANLPWMRATATIISGFGAALEGYVAVPSLAGLMRETPLMTLDAEFGAIYMGEESSGSSDPTLPGAILTDASRWTTTVLRHSRW